MKEVETCFICQLGIDMAKGDYVRITDFNVGKEFNTIYGHKNCWREHMSNKVMNKKAIGANLNFINKMQERFLT